jgi:hypothetical protein
MRFPTYPLKTPSIVGLFFNVCGFDAEMISWNGLNNGRLHNSSKALLPSSILLSM